MSEGGRWKTAYVSGGASGIGLRLAEQLAARGAAIALFDLRIGAEARSRLGSAASAHEVDVTDAAALSGAFQRAAEQLGPPELAINSAGIQLSKAFEALTEDEFRRVVEVNLTGSRNFAAAALPLMGPGAQLALIASLAGFIPNYGYAAYNASKFGVVGLAGALRLECRPRGIDVAVICPPEVETPMVAGERSSGDPIGLELKRAAGTLDVDRACREIIAGLEARRSTIVPGRRAKLFRRLSQIAPGTMAAIADRLVERTLRRRSSADSRG